MNPTRVSIAVLTSVMVFCPALKAESYRVVLRAAQAFEEGQGAWKVQLNEDKAVVLYDRVLIEDDGPGIGSVAEWMKTDRAPTTVIGGRTLIKKVLHIDRLGACERGCVYRRKWPLNSMAGRSKSQPLRRSPRFPSPS